MTAVRIYLKRNKEESLKRMHPWVFSGAIARGEGEPEEGDLVDVLDSTGNFLGRGHCQIGAIAVRVLTFEDEVIDGRWWEAKISKALELRQAIGMVPNPDTDCYRLVHGEGDSLPGLIVDIYNDTAVVQCHSVGMYLSRESITTALREVYGPRLSAVYDKSSQTVPFNAGLDAADGFLWRSDGAADGKDTAAGIVRENGLEFRVNWVKGQKTGFFLDQRDSRELVGKYSKGRRVLNTFCYTGGFSVYASRGGAALVDSVDSSRIAVEAAAQNMELNFGESVRHNAITADAMDFLRDMEDDSYDLIILDPPAFAKHHKVLGNALQGYKRLNARAISKISRGGIIFTFSCSQAVSREQFRTTVFSAAAIAGRKVRILHQLTQPADHPINIYHPEGEYLKGLVLFVE